MAAEPGLTFEDALKELEGIVADLERGAPDLSAALARYEQGVRLLARCQSLLAEAEQTVALLTGVDDAGRPLTAPLNAAPLLDRDRPESAPDALDDGEADGLPF